MFRQCSIQKEKYMKVTPLNLGFEDCEKGHSFGPAVRFYWLLHYIVSGKGTYQADGREFTVTKGQAFLIKPGEITRYYADNELPWTYIWISFNGDMDKLNRLPYIIENDGLRAVMDEIYRKNRYSDEDQPFAIAKIWQAIDCLSENLFEDDKSSYVTRAKNIINQQPFETLSIQSIADQLNLDRSYFSNLFKKETGISPKQYITAHRMNRALYLLSRKKYSVSVVASSVGFSDPFSFSRSFKQFFGVPPRRCAELESDDTSNFVKISP